MQLSEEEFQQIKDDLEAIKMETASMNNERLNYETNKDHKITHEKRVTFKKEKALQSTLKAQNEQDKIYQQDCIQRIENSVKTQKLMRNIACAGVIGTVYAMCLSSSYSNFMNKYFSGY